MIFIFFVFFIYYVINLFPSIPVRDSGEFITVAKVLGCAHPPGYPVYTILVRLFSFLPLGNIAYRINLFSAFCGSLTCAMIYQIVSSGIFIQIENHYKKESFRKDINNSEKQMSVENNYFINNKLFVSKFSGILAAFYVGFNKLFFSESVVSEVFTLNALFVVSIIFLSLFLIKISKYQQISPEKLNVKSMVDKNIIFFSPYSVFYLILLMLAFSLCNHHTIIFIFPGFIWLIYVFTDILSIKNVFKKFRFINYHFVIYCIVIFISGLSFYGYLFLRGKQNPVINWGLPGKNVDNFINVILRKSYGTLSLAKAAQDFSFSENMKYHLINFFSDIFLSGSIIFCVIFLFKFIYSLKSNNKNIFIFFVINFFVSGIFFIILSNLPVSPEAKMMLKRFEIMPLIFVILFMFFDFEIFDFKHGKLQINEIASQEFTLSKANVVHNDNVHNVIEKNETMKQSKIKNLFSITLLVILSIPVLVKFKLVNESRNNYLVDDFISNLYMGLPKQTIVFTKKDTFVFSHWVKKYVFEKRPDIVFLGQDLICGSWFMNTISETEKHIKLDNFNCKKPLETIYYDNMNNLKIAVLYDYDYDKENVFFQENKKYGFLMNTLNYDYLLNCLPQMISRNKLCDADINDYFNYEIKEKYSLGFMNIGQNYLNNKQPGKAIEYFESSTRIDKNNTMAVNYKSYAYFVNNDFKNSIKSYKRAIKLLKKKLLQDIYSFKTKTIFESELVDAYTNCGVAYEKLNRVDEAVIQYKAALSINPYVSRVHYNLGIAYWKQSKWNKVLEEFKIVQSIEPGNREVVKYMLILNEKINEKKQ